MTAAAIAYDKPVHNFIAGLDATGHVTNTPYRKTSITWHHNGGRLSLQGCLDVWKTREASAHFDVDGVGAVGQYAGVNMYAWHAGNTQGNKESIGIEMADATLAPGWTIAEATWKEAARLAGWLHARVIGVRPSRATCHVHHDWKATLCAGPFVDSVLNTMIAEAQAAYDYFMRGSKPSPAPAPAPGRVSVAEIARQVLAGKWGNGPDRIARLRAAGYDYNAVQAEVNRLTGGGAPAPAPKPSKTITQIAQEVLAGEWGNDPQRSQRLAAAGFSAAAVQAEVNRLVGGARPVSTRLSIGVLAQQVIAGQWGNGVERERRITAAGYDYAAVRAEVNRRLG